MCAVRRGLEEYKYKRDRCKGQLPDAVPYQHAGDNAGFFSVGADVAPGAMIKKKWIKHPGGFITTTNFLELSEWKIIFFF